MARYMVGAKTSGAGTAAQPQISLWNVASFQAKVRELGAFNTTNTATDIRLVKATALGTPGAALTEAKYDNESVAPQATGVNTHSADATLVDGGYRASLGAAIGAGIIWTFGDTGIKAASGTGGGVGITPADGATGQILQAYIVWDE